MNKFLLLTTFILIASSCKKDTPTVTPKKPIDFLTEKSWKYLTFNNHLKPCDADDVINFQVDAQFSIDLGTNHCSTNEIDQITGSWTFINKESQVIKEYMLFGNPLTDTLTIIKLDDEKFEYIDENNNNVVLEH